MTDEELALARAEAARFLAAACETNLPELTRERTAVFAKLFHELDALRARNAAIVQLVENMIPVYTKGIQATQATINFLREVTADGEMMDDRSVMLLRAIFPPVAE